MSSESAEIRAALCGMSVSRSSVPCIGVDPGSMNGGALLLEPDAETVIDWLVWQKMARDDGDVYRSKQGNGDEQTHPSLFWHVHSWAQRLPSVYQTVVEGLFVPRRDGTLKVHEMLTLAESAGEIRAAFCGCTAPAIPILRPRATTWRPMVAGIPACTPRAKAEAQAITKAKAYFKWVGGWPGSKLTKAERGALAEAAWIARYGISIRLYDKELRKFFAKGG